MFTADRRYRLALLLMSAVLLTAGSGTQAASQDECAGWLCATVGFAIPECEPAKLAMTKRLFQGKSPLPAFGSCTANGEDDGMSAMYTVAAKINSDPVKYQLGTRCVQRSSNDPRPGNPTNTNPSNCIGTVRVLWVFQHGEPLGSAHFMPLR